MKLQQLYRTSLSAQTAYVQKCSHPGKKQKLYKNFINLEKYTSKLYMVHVYNSSPLQLYSFFYYN